MTKIVEISLYSNLVRVSDSESHLPENSDWNRQHFYSVIKDVIYKGRDIEGVKRELTGLAVTNYPNDAVTKWFSKNGIVL